MGISAPWYDYIEMITFHPVKKMWGMKPMRFSAPWEKSPDRIAFHPVKTNHQG